MENKYQIDFQKLQKKSIKEMLNITDTKTLESDCVWKILIFDTFCQAIMSTLYKVGDLREENVTLHLNIEAKREMINSVNTIYFMKPTLANLNKFSEDLGKNLYEGITINFCSVCPEEYLDSLANIVISKNYVSKIHKVFPFFNLDI